MCGRFTLKTPERVKLERIVNTFDLDNIIPRYNIAPTQDVLTILERDNVREVTYLQWGLIPFWSKEAKGFINARVETIDQKPTFNESFQRRRCLIPADGFYEWLKAKKQPFYFRLTDHGLFALAGLWEEWVEPGSGEILETCTIITTEPNKLVAQVHPRMPAMLLPENEAAWLDPDNKAADVLSLLGPYPVEKMELVEVSRAVNSASAQGPELIEPVSE